MSATKPPRTKSPSDILSEEGLRRYFVVHGGLFSQDDVTLEDVRKIQRVGRQPGTEGLMCKLQLSLVMLTLRRSSLGEVWNMVNTVLRLQ